MTDALIGALGAIVAAAILSGNRKLNQIHVLVNSRLTEALEEIRSLKAEKAAVVKKATRKKAT